MWTYQTKTNLLKIHVSTLPIFVIYLFTHINLWNEECAKEYICKPYIWKCFGVKSVLVNVSLKSWKNMGKRIHGCMRCRYSWAGLGIQKAITVEPRNSHKRYVKDLCRLSRMCQFTLSGLHCTIVTIRKFKTAQSFFQYFLPLIVRKNLMGCFCF